MLFIKFSCVSRVFLLDSAGETFFILVTESAEVRMLLNQYKINGLPGKKDAVTSQSNHVLDSENEAPKSNLHQPKSHLPGFRS